MVNPKMAPKLLADDKAATEPELRKAKALLDKGEYKEALKSMAAGFPFMGPMIKQMAETWKTEPWRVGTQVVAPVIAGAVGPKLPAMAEAVKGLPEAIPGYLEAAKRGAVSQVTGSPAAKGIELASTLGGGVLGQLMGGHDLTGTMVGASVPPTLGAIQEMLKHRSLQGLPEGLKANPMGEQFTVSPSMQRLLNMGGSGVLGGGVASGVSKPSIRSFGGSVPEADIPGGQIDLNAALQRRLNIGQGSGNTGGGVASGVARTPARDFGGDVPDTNTLPSGEKFKVNPAIQRLLSKGKGSSDMGGDVATGSKGKARRVNVAPAIEATIDPVLDDLAGQYARGKKFDQLSPADQVAVKAFRAKLGQ